MPCKRCLLKTIEILDQATVMSRIVWVSKIKRMLQENFIKEAIKKWILNISK
jgi:hypothetical protein